MKLLPIQRSITSASRLVLGCMGLGGGWSKDPISAEHITQAHCAVDTALSVGISMFDHADIYAFGKAETVFGKVLKDKPGLREKILLQSKCGIRFPEDNGTPARYDFSASYIINSVEGILRRLSTDYLDVLMLHRPDALMDADEVADAFRLLKTSGKVRHFGVSNMSAGQIRLLQSRYETPLVANQLEMSLQKTGWLETGVHVNQTAASNDIFPEGTLEFCQMENIQLQAWGSLAQGIYSGTATGQQSETVQKTAALVKQLAEIKDTSTEAIVLAWLMKHPASIQPVIGTTSPARIHACSDAVNVTLSRDEWYSLYVSSRGIPLP